MVIQLDLQDRAVHTVVEEVHRPQAVQLAIHPPLQVQSATVVRVVRHSVVVGGRGIMVVAGLVMVEAGVVPAMLSMAVLMRTE